MQIGLLTAWDLPAGSTVDAASNDIALFVRGGISVACSLACCTRWSWSKWMFRGSHRPQEAEFLGQKLRGGHYIYIG